MRNHPRPPALFGRLSRALSAASAAALLASAPAFGGGCTLLLNDPAEQCDRTSDCVAKGGDFAASVCNAKKVCVPILTEDCQKVVGEIDDDTVLIGTMTSLSGTNASTGQARIHSAELALDDLRAFSIGLPRGPGQKPRPLALVECDQDKNLERAARHLTEELGVPALIGPAHTGDTLEIAQNVTIPERVLMINPSAASTQITSLDDNGLVWRTSSSDKVEAFAVSLLLPEVEADLRAAQKLTGADKIRVAVLAKSDAYGKGLSDAMFPLLRFNGTDVKGNDQYFLRREMPDPSSDPDFDPTQVVADLAAFKPNIVLLFGTAEMLNKGMAKLEAAWPSGSGAPPRPRYLLTEGAKNAALFDLVGSSNDDLRHRVLGFEPRPDDQLYPAFKFRYEAKFGPSPEVYGMAGTYDAMYLLIYSLVSLGEAPINGPSLAQALTRMVPPGPRIDAGPDGLAPAFAALQKGGNIDYNGVSGPLDFDVSTGEAPANYDIWCVTRDLQGAPQFSSSGRYFDTTSNALTGKLSCP